MPTYQPGKGIGHFLGAMRTDAFRPAEEFNRDMEIWIRRFREAIPAEGQERVLIPGDPEREAQEQRLLYGIPLLSVVYEDLTQLGQKFGVKL
jgi:LDH2 family malate/lactate/ureidoglycolate dehydrogenase